MATKSKKQIIEELSRHTNYGCYTRQALEILIWPEIKDEARFLIFADIDFMHSLNIKYGKSEVNRRVKKSMRVRKSDIASVVPASYSSGDELLWIILGGERAGDPEKMTRRLFETFKKNGVPATFSIVPITSKKLSVNIDRADSLVSKAKKNKRRGSISRS